MTEKSAKPQLRFAGFDDTWEQRKLSELYEKASRKNDLTYGKYDIFTNCQVCTISQPDSYITNRKIRCSHIIFCEIWRFAFEGNKTKTMLTVALLTAILSETGIVFPRLYDVSSQ